MHVFISDLNLDPNICPKNALLCCAELSLCSVNTRLVITPVMATARKIVMIMRDIATIDVLWALPATMECKYCCTMPETKRAP